MLTSTIRVLLALVCVTLWLSCQAHAAETKPNNFANPKSGAEEKVGDSDSMTPDETAALPSLEERVKKLPLRDRITQLMLVTLLGKNTPNSDDMQFLTKYVPGGVIIPASLRPSSAAGYVTALRVLPLEKQKGLPLFIAANLYDLEQPGRTAFFSQLPSLLSIAAANDPDTTERLGTFIAEYLNTMGFNMHLGPTLELAPTLPDALGSIQSLGSSPEFAASAGAAIVHSLAEHGIIAVPTGFPGGGTNHLAKQPAVLITPKDALAKNDVLPYARAIEQGAQMIHVANTRVPTLEPDKRPASLSKVVMRDLLRDQLKFDGVILVGPLDTTDVSAMVDPLQACVQAIMSGADMVRWNETGPRVIKAID